MKMIMLSEMADYVTDKISMTGFDNSLYVSTDSMLKDKGGITEPESTPSSGNVTKYQPCDILVSNIRPYFKKIWFANRTGGCSNDVLVFRAKENIDSRYLYYALSSDLFFEHMMMGANGTKMPRGNKILIPTYELCKFDIDAQRRIAAKLSRYDSLIENYQKQIKLLEEAAQRLYKEWFIDLRFPGHEHIPVVDGVPEGWEIKRISDVVDFYDKSRKPLSSKQRQGMEQLYPYYGAASLMGYVDNYIFDGTYLLMGEDGTVISNEKYPMLQYVWGKFWVSNHAHVIQGKSPYSTELIYMIFRNLSILDIVTGAAQPKISQGRLASKKILIPSINICKKYDSIIQPLFIEIKFLKTLIDNLTEARDRLLPKLMSGEIEV